MVTIRKSAFLAVNILTVGNSEVGILMVSYLAINILMVGNSEVGILTVSYLAINILTVGNLEVGILTVGYSAVDIFTQRRNFVIDSCKRVIVGSWTMPGRMYARAWRDRVGMWQHKLTYLHGPHLNMLH
jgi:hypothetical protein